MFGQGGSYAKPTLKTEFTEERRPMMIPKT